MRTTIVIKVTGEAPPLPDASGRPFNPFKAQARKCSLHVPGASEKAGPECSFQSGERKYRAVRLDRSQTTFGVGQIGKDKRTGFKALVDWSWDDTGGFGLVTLDMSRAAAVGVDTWLEQYVQAIIVACEWTIVVPKEPDAEGNGDTLPPAPAPTIP